MNAGKKYLAMAFVTIVISSFFLKEGAMNAEPLMFAAIAYGIGTVVAYLAHRKDIRSVDEKHRGNSLKLRTVIGVANFFGVYLILKALETGPGTVIFPVLSLSLAVIALVSIAAFKERLNAKGKLGLMLALLSVLLLQ